VRFHNATPQTTYLFTDSVDEQGEPIIETIETGPYNGYPAFMAHGVGVTTGQPRIMAGMYRTSDFLSLQGVNATRPIPAGQGVTLNAADLVNDGEEDVLLHSIVMTYPQFNPGRFAINSQEPIPVQLAMTGVGPEYLINPINGPQWMPGSKTIPLLSICPLTCPVPLNFDWSLFGHFPTVFEFCENTTLLRRQRLSVKFYDNVTLSHTLDVTLFGYLEVR
jgi:hypothetical protein